MADELDAITSQLRRRRTQMLTDTVPRFISLVQRVGIPVR